LGHEALAVVNAEDMRFPVRTAREPAPGRHRPGGRSCGMLPPLGKGASDPSCVFTW